MTRFGKRLQGRKRSSVRGDVEGEWNRSEQTFPWYMRTRRSGPHKEKGIFWRIEVMKKGVCFIIFKEEVKYLVAESMIRPGIKHQLEEMPVEEEIEG
jgi:hypothetical protein